jgi:hypothetical protein
MENALVCFHSPIHSQKKLTVVELGLAILEYFEMLAEYVRLSGHGKLNDILGRNAMEWTADAD